MFPFIFLILLPYLVDADCYNAKVRLICGTEDYVGPLVINLYDDNFFLFGGDKKILARDYQVKKGKLIQIRDTRDDCWFYEPYIIFTSYCKKSEGMNVFKEWVDYFRRKFFTTKDTHIYTLCRKVPLEANEITIQLAEEDEC